MERAAGQAQPREDSCHPQPGERWSGASGVRELLEEGGTLEIPYIFLPFVSGH